MLLMYLKYEIEILKCTIIFKKKKKTRMDIIFHIINSLHFCYLKLYIISCVTNYMILQILFFIIKKKFDYIIIKSNVWSVKGDN